MNRLFYVMWPNGEVERCGNNAAKAVDYARKCAKNGDDIIVVKEVCTVKHEKKEEE